MDIECGSYLASNLQHAVNSGVVSWVRREEREREREGQRKRKKKETTGKIFFFFFSFLFNSSSSPLSTLSSFISSSSPSLLLSRTSLLSLQDLIDAHLTNNFAVLMRLGYFDPPDDQPFLNISTDAINTPDHQGKDENIYNREAKERDSGRERETERREETKTETETKDREQHDNESQKDKRGRKEGEKHL
jgi:hypothetical protein